MERSLQVSSTPKVTVVHITKNDEGDFITEEIVGGEDDDVESLPETRSPPAKKPKRPIKKESVVGDSDEKSMDNHPLQTAVIEPDNLLRNYIDLILVDGLPFDFLDGKIGRTFFGQLNMYSGLTVDTGTLCEYITMRVKQMKRLFEADMANRPISLLIEFDGEQNTCGILAQFINKKIEQRFLGYLDLAKYENGTERWADIQSLCASYGLSEKLIYAAMTANETAETDIQLPPSVFRLTCLAELFRNAIIAALMPWKSLLDKVLKGGELAATNRSLDELLKEINIACEKKLKGMAKSLPLDADDWKTLSSISDWLAMAKATYDKIQDAQTHPVVTDVVATVFKFWIQLGKQKEPVPQVFAKSLKAKFCNELSNWGPINAAIFLDPRIQQLLSASDKSAARTHITEVHVRWTCDEEATAKETTVPEMSLSEDDEDDEDDLTAFLKEQSKTGQAAAQTSKIERLLQDFTDAPLVSAKTSVLSYWEKSERDGTLRELSQTILAIPGVARSWVDREHIRRLYSNKSFTPNMYMDDILFLGGNHYIMN